MFEKLTLLEENNATLRLLLILLYECQANPRRELIDRANAYGVGNTAFYRSLKTLKQLELISEKKENKEVIATLTDKGIEIAQKVSIINDILTIDTL